MSEGITLRLIDEPLPRDTRRLGRHVEHDERSRAFPAETAPITSVLHAHHGAVLDQGELGSCTGNAAAQNLMCAPLFLAHRVFGEAVAVSIYEHATLLDSVPGNYPPTDTGSSGLAAAKACKQMGYATAYTHAFGIDHALGALMRSPVMIGSPWYEAMFDPDPHTGLVQIGGKLAGGHEWALIGYDADRQECIALNSWAATWGLNGRFRLTKATLAALLDDGGDVTVLVR